jgi:CheY-like chemotaxis protein
MIHRLTSYKMFDVPAKHLWNMAITFLLIDDDEDDRMLFCEALNDVDPVIQCLTEGNGRIMLAKLDTEELARTDIIFLDINLPSINGWEILKKLKQHHHYRDIPVIMYSTSARDFYMDQAQEHGAASVMKKPSDFKDLKRSLEEIIQHLERGSLPLLV